MFGSSLSRPEKPAATGLSVAKNWRLAKMCKECHSWPHLPGCPEGPEAKPDYICGWCGEPIFEDEYYDFCGVMVCPDCIEKRRRLL